MSLNSNNRNPLSEMEPIKYKISVIYNNLILMI